MAQSQRPEVQPIRRRGASCCVVISRRILQQLGWSEHDMLSVTTARGCVVMTKVQLPTPAALAEVEVAG